MSHALTKFLEPLESRRHLAAHPLALTPQQEVQFNLGLLAAYVASLSGAPTPSADPLATPPANPPGTDVLTSSGSPDGVDVLVSSSSPLSGAPSTPGISPAATASPFSATAITIGSDLFNLG